MTKDEYKRRIWRYKRRRSILRNTCHSLSMKIRQWEACLRMRKCSNKKRNERLRKLVTTINEYFLVNIVSKSRDAKHILARNIYYRVGLESKISGVALSKYISRSRAMAARGRKQLIRSFEKKYQNKEAYHNFKKYFEN